MQRNNLIQIIKKQLGHELDKTNFGLGRIYSGKVRDNYILDGKRLIITTDRLSAFDRFVCTVPFKGQVLSQICAFWFEKTRHIVDNHFIKEIDPNVMLVKECMPYKVEIIVRAYLTGVTKTSVWYNYERGVRNFCGNKLSDGLKRNQKLPGLIITPTTKGDKGVHDQLISGEDVIKRGLIPENVYRLIEKIALKLFDYGTRLVAKQNLILVDTKYEFGYDDVNKVVLIDEIHTPDSSRFWIKDSYENLFLQGKEPNGLDKEYVRTWLAEQGFKGEGSVPSIPEDVITETSRRYINAYEMITGKGFICKNEDVLERIKNSLERNKMIWH